MFLKLLILHSRLFPLVFILCSAFSQTFAKDVVILDRPLSTTDRRNDYAALLLTNVMERTAHQYGPYEIRLAPMYMERKRLLEELKTGKIVNVSAQPSQQSWETNLETIRIPVDLGLQSWRIALIDKKNQTRLNQIETLDQLKALRVGVGNGWATYGILKEDGFNVVSGANYDGLFEMLTLGRFDYFLRGTNEIFVEFDDRKDKNPFLAVEENFVVHVPLPWLFFTSPNTPRLAKRISAGMEEMLKDGSLQHFMLTHHKTYLTRAKLCSRRVFEVANPNVGGDFLKRKEVWFDPFNPKNGLCSRKKQISH